MTWESTRRAPIDPAQLPAQPRPSGARSASSAGARLGRTANYHAVVSEAPLWLTIPVALLLVALGAASAVMARGGFAGSLSRKSRMGVHSPAAMASDEASALANRVAAPVAGGAAVVAVLSAVLMI